MFLTTSLACCGAGSTMRTYVLGNPPSQTIGVWSESGLPVVALESVSVPDYLDSSDILRHTGPNEVTPSPTGRWGDRLSQDVTHALASDLSNILPKVVVVTSFVSDPFRRIFVEIERFDIEADGRCLLAARWHITAADGKSLSKSRHGTFSVTATSLDDPSVAAAMTLAIDQLAAQIAKNDEFQ
jgi:uncharacterized lipoprotein YmbA